MTAIQISTHQADALARLLDQYKGKPLLAGLLNAFTAQIQNLENTLFTVLNGRDIFHATGAQLDAVGGVVGLPRQPAWGDTLYQALLVAQVGVNTSQGTPEQIISIFKTMSQATHVDYQETYPCGIWLMANAAIDPTLVSTLWQFLNEVLPAGVRIDGFGHFDPANAFTLAGGSTGGGLDDGTAAIGGALAALYQPAVPVFALDGDTNNPNVSGLGDSTDPVVGGQLQSA